MQPDSTTQLDYREIYGHRPRADEGVHKLKSNGRTVCGWFPHNIFEWSYKSKDVTCKRCRSKMIYTKPVRR